MELALFSLERDGCNLPAEFQTDRGFGPILVMHGRSHRVQRNGAVKILVRLDRFLFRQGLEICGSLKRGGSLSAMRFWRPLIRNTTCPRSLRSDDKGALTSPANPGSDAKANLTNCEILILLMSEQKCFECVENLSFQEGSQEGRPDPETTP